MPSINSKTQFSDSMMMPIEENDEASISLSESFKSVGSPSPLANAKRILQKNRISFSKKAASFKKKTALKRTVSIINNQYKNLQSLREKKPILMMKRVEQEDHLQNTSGFKFKKFVKQSVDSNPHLK